MKLMPQLLPSRLEMSEVNLESKEKPVEKVVMKRTLNLFGAIAMTVGCIIGSGIYVSPKGVLRYTGSVGLNMIIWVLCGLIAMGASFCFAELCTLVPESGGQWAYIRTGLGNAPAFILAWSGLISASVGAATLSLASAGYFLSNIFVDCAIPNIILKLTAMLLLWTALYINSCVKWAEKVMKTLFILKLVSLGLIILGGLYWLFAHGAEKLHNSFEGTTNDGFSVATAFYSGLWAYDGWDVATNVAEEVKNVRKTLPRAIVGSTLLMIVLYLLVNVSYYAVLTKQEVLASPVVAVDWGYKIVGSWSQLFSIIVGLSIYGSAVASLFGNSRSIMVVARQGHTVQLLSMVSIKDNAPLAALMLRGSVATVLVWVGDVSNLIDFSSFTTWVFLGLCFVSLIVMKLKKYKADDPNVFRVPIVLPFIMTAIALYLVLVPIISQPRLYYLYVVIFMCGGLLFYFPFVYCKVKATWFDKVTIFFQRLFQLSIPDKTL